MHTFPRTSPQHPTQHTSAGCRQQQRTRARATATAAYTGFYWRATHTGEHSVATTDSVIPPIIEPQQLPCIALPRPHTHVQVGTRPAAHCPSLPSCCPTPSQLHLVDQPAQHVTHLVDLLVRGHQWRHQPDDVTLAGSDDQHACCPGCLHQLASRHVQLHAHQ
jgi:hypothetical protein